MEKINLLHNEELYHSGLIAEQFSECLYASDYVNEMVLENIKTLSDEHTYYYCILLRKIKKSDYSITVIFDTHEGHLLLLNYLNDSQLNVNCVDINGMNLEYEKLPSKIKKKHRKKLEHDFKKPRHLEPIKQKEKLSLINKIKKRFKRESDDFYEE